MRLAQLTRFARLLAPAQLVRPGRTLSRRVKARLAVLTGGSAVLLTMGGMAVVVETIRPEWRDPEYGHRLKQIKQIAWHESRNGNRPIVAVVGSSRVAIGFSPLHLGFAYTPTSPVVYNFAHTTYGPSGELLAVRRLLDSGVAPSYLLIEVMPPFLNEAAVPDTLLPEHSSFADLERLAPYRADPQKSFRAWGTARLNSWYSLRLSLLCHAGAEAIFPEISSVNVWRGMKVGGWTPPPRTVSPEEQATALEWTRGGYSHYFENFRIDPLQDRIYRDLLTLCRQRGIQVAFFLMPESPAFRSWYPPGGREMVRNYLKTMASEQGHPVFDASEWVSDESQFRDGHHLVGVGAESFSQRFGKECLAPWVNATLR